MAKDNRPIKRAFPIGNDAGMFAGLNQLVNQWSCADARKYTVSIDWRNCVYSREYGVADAWDQYFKRTDHTAKQAHVLSNEKTKYMGGGLHNIITPRGPVFSLSTRTWKWDVPYADASQVILLPPKRPWRAKYIIDRYLHMHDAVFNAAAKTTRALDAAESPIIGVHVRGAGREHGGVKYLLQSHRLESPPYSLYFEYLDALFMDYPTLRIFLATDCANVRNIFAAHYGRDRVFWRETDTVLPGGEGHLRIGERGAETRYRLGMDALVDAVVLCSCQHIVHGNSNLSNFVQCLGADISHYDIFEPIYLEHEWL